jgi:hypothetical protein
VTLEAGFVSVQESEAAGFERLLNIGPPAFDRDSLVRVVTIRATHFAFQHRMMVRQLELCAHFQVALETNFWRLPRIDDRTSPTASFDMQTPGTVARFAAHVRGLLYSYAALCLTAFSAALVYVYDFPLCSLQSRMGGCSEVAHDLFVARRTLLRADELRARDAGRRKNCLVCGAARKQNHGERDCPPDAPQNFLALTVDPSN